MIWRLLINPDVSFNICFTLLISSNFQLNFQIEQQVKDLEEVISDLEKKRDEVKLVFLIVQSITQL